MCETPKNNFPAKDKLLGALRQKTKIPGPKEPGTPSAKNLRIIKTEEEDNKIPFKPKSRRNGSRRRDPKIHDSQELIALGIAEHDAEQEEAQTTIAENNNGDNVESKIEASITPIHPLEKEPEKMEEDFYTIKELFDLDHFFGTKRYVRSYNVGDTHRAFDLLEGTGKWVEFSEEAWYGTEENGSDGIRFMTLPTERYREIIKLKAAYKEKQVGSKAKKRKTED